jgi:DNA-3-methyladenine glycosylase
MRGTRPARRPARWGPVLPRPFYERSAPVVARALLGCVLVSRNGGACTAGRIVETEAYLGPEDAASHAAFRRSSRWLFYGPGGIAYVFRAYGLHYCLNAIAGPRGRPGCVLIRAVEPTRGVDVMRRRRRRRGLTASSRSTRGLVALASGPARLTQALAITLRDNGHDLRRGRLTIHARPVRTALSVVTGRRIGITRSADLRLRFWVRGNPFVSGGSPAGRAGGVAEVGRARRRSRRGERAPRRFSSCVATAR